jgi:flagellar basal-body rod modification protein FlgD
MADIATETVPWLRETAAAATTTSASKTTLGKDDFLKLLITELQYQDPLEPMKDTEFISQMANFSSLEQMQNLNTGFEKLASNLNDFLIPALMIQQATNLIGREISYQDPEASEAKLLKGVVSSVTFKNGTAYCVIDGKEIDMTYLAGIGSPVVAENKELDQLMDRLDDLLTLITPEEGGEGE